jgi:hypothetical protein
MDDQLDYALDEWSVEARQLLDRLLTTNDITHAWQGGRLSVSPDDEQTVDDLVDEVESTILPTLDPGADRVVYEVAEWSPEARADLGDALIEEGVRYEFDGLGDLVVEAIDEDRVDAIIDELADEDDEADAGPEANDVLSDLFVAADKLRRNPRDAKAAGATVQGVTEVITLEPPYGFDRRTWAQIGLRAGALRAALDTEPSDDDAVIAAAEELRTLLHPMV